MKRCFGSDKFPKRLSFPVVALGNFDGVHLGHQALIGSARDIADKNNGTCVVYTFDPHPVRVLSPKSCPALLQTVGQKLAALEKLGVDICVIESFTAEFSHLNERGFFKNVIVDRLGTSAVVAGYDFTFGLHRHGTADTLEALGREFGVAIHIIDAQFAGETLISSTNIRRLIRDGAVKAAWNLLGRPFAIRGTVVKGRGIGGRILVHTANMKTSNEIIPCDGVYITRTGVWSGPEDRPEDAQAYASATNIGDNPTFPDSQFAIETHLLDMEKDIVGCNIEVEFLERIREQVAFATPSELGDQIQRDLDEARMYHRHMKGNG